jgi:hypothetical protein
VPEVQDGVEVGCPDGCPDGCPLGVVLGLVVGELVGVREGGDEGCPIMTSNDSISKEAFTLFAGNAVRGIARKNAGFEATN